MEIQYRKEAGRYSVYKGGERLFDCDEVGLLIDVETGGLVSHGVPDYVEAKYHALRLAFTDAGLTEEGALVFVKGMFEPEELNKMLSIQGYAGRFYNLHIATTPSPTGH